MNEQVNKFDIFFIPPITVILDVLTQNYVSTMKNLKNATFREMLKHLLTPINLEDD